MTRTGEKQSSNKEAVLRGEARPHMVEIPPQLDPRQLKAERAARIKGAGSHGQDAKLVIPAGDR